MIKPAFTVSTELPPVAENEVRFGPEDAERVALRWGGHSATTPEDWEASEDESQDVSCLLTSGSLLTAENNVSGRGRGAHERQ